jgi:hypothetical protein
LASAAPVEQYDSLADEYDSWYDGKGRLAFGIDLAVPRPLLSELRRSGGEEASRRRSLNAG